MSQQLYISSNATDEVNHKSMRKRLASLGVSPEVIEEEVQKFIKENCTNTGDEKDE